LRWKKRTVSERMIKVEEKTVGERVITAEEKEQLGKE
jgi:hypothetical protein